MAITSTRGVARCQLGVGATTLHHWSRNKDGRLTKDEQFADARKKIHSTQTLIIDEVGMLSKLMFEKVELVCRLVKDRQIYFYGL